MSSVTSVLIVDDEPAVRDVMAHWLAGAGVDVRTAASADEALVATRQRRCDLAVVDVRMPARDGLWLTAQLQRADPHTAVVLATAYADVLDRRDATVNVADLLVKPFARDRFLLAVDRGRQWRKRALDDRRWQAQLSVEVRERAAEIASRIADAAASGRSEMEALVAIVSARTPEVIQHGARVAAHAVATARAMALDPILVGLVETTARVHDIGKAAMPEPLLTKPSTYTADEQVMMQRHVDVGADILAGTTTLAGTAPMVLAGHQWYGGGGYPLKLAGDDIPLVSRIIAVADAYDAMTEPCSYRPARETGDAVSELLRCSPAQFDPVVVAAFLDVIGRAR